MSSTTVRFRVGRGQSINPPQCLSTVELTDPAGSTRLTYRYELDGTTYFGYEPQTNQEPPFDTVHYAVLEFLDSETYEYTFYPPGSSDISSVACTGPCVAVIQANAERNIQMRTPNGSGGLARLTVVGTKA